MTSRADEAMLFKTTIVTVYASLVSCHESVNKAWHYWQSTEIQIPGWIPATVAVGSEGAFLRTRSPLGPVLQVLPVPDCHLGRALPPSLPSVYKRSNIVINIFRIIHRFYHPHS
ncbi:hypothetical protein TNIN_479201 [Trichonephila inaurata madagascariensis]|uniref:Uncharacterized protein n=1 Tax=Trichonephila inaurata madagascariensis TaxID=2747483 RepID=A0A8X6XPX2_9ARAC|nr:hypothetical protein TNIN_479201 [Trichonephila inaurata madagascariensis]